MYVKDYIEERAMEIARYIIENNATVRQAAKQFGISKSTVHKDITERLKQINYSMAAETRKVLDVNRTPYSWWTCYQRKIFASAWIDKSGKNISITVYLINCVDGRVSGV